MSSIRLLSWPTALALLVDAAVHLREAGRYDVPDGGILGEGNLFRGQAVVALIALAWVLARPTRLSFAFAGLVAAVAAAAVITSTYIDLGAIGPLPDLYEPTWAAPGKVPSMVAEVAAVPFAIAGVVLSRRPMSRARRAYAQ